MRIIHCSIECLYVPEKFNEKLNLFMNDTLGFIIFFACGKMTINAPRVILHQTYKGYDHKDKDNLFLNFAIEILARFPINAYGV